MSVIRTEDVEIEDLMWFGIDESGEIAHFTSGVYGPVPRSVCRSREHLSVITDYFEDELKESTIGIPSKTFLDFVNLIDNNDETIRKYLAPSLRMSSKGLYSYDSFDAHPYEGKYFRVSVPRIPLKIDNLPSNISKILMATLIKGIYFREMKMVQVEL